MRRLPFRTEFLDAIRAGRKTCTARARRLGAPGDELATEAGVVILTKVERVPLSVVRDAHWREEGCDSKEEFVRIWNEIHPRRGFEPERLVYLHHFRLLS